MIQYSLEKMIGNTPLFQLRRINDGVGPKIYLKLEQFNPGGSIKDRTALGMIQAAEEAGVLRPSMHIIESSSGNTAIGLAMLGIEKGYHVTAICDRHLPVTKRARLRAFGADIVFLPDTPSGMDTVEIRIAVANYLAENVPNTITLGQYSNPANVQIHYETTGPEIWNDLDGNVSAVVMAVGTCGTITGVGKALKARNPATKIIGVEPEGSIIFGGENGNYLIQGGGLSFIPSILDRDVIDEGWKVKDADSVMAVHNLAAREGWMVGGTGGLVAHVLKEIAGRFGPDDNIVGIIPDGGERYLDTLYHDEWLRQHSFNELQGKSSFYSPADLETVNTIGCSINEIPEGSSMSLEELSRQMNLESNLV